MASLLAAFAQVVLIDLTLASDNAIAIGMAASGLPEAQRRRAIFIGLAFAVVLLCTLAFFAVKLLEIGGPGLVLAGGLLLLMICWQMWRDLRGQRSHGQADAAASSRKPRTLPGVLLQIFIADISTSLDNVLAVAGAVRDQPTWVLFAGLGLSVLLTGFAASIVAKLLQRWPWIGYVGLAVVLFVSGHMIWDGIVDLHWLKF